MTCNTPLGYKFNLYFSDGPRGFSRQKVRVRQDVMIVNIYQTIKFIKVKSKTCESSVEGLEGFGLTSYMTHNIIR